MSPALTICAALLFAAAPDPRAGATPARPAPAAAHAPLSTVEPTAKPKPAAKPKPTAKPRPVSPASSVPRTLSEVHIEGEIPVPQVLFITSREPGRFMDFQHHRYLRSSTRLGEDTPLPTWVAVIHGSPADSRKETSQ